jgi:hypothetical protein
MAKPVASALKPIGVFFALTSQNTRQAPFVTAAEVAKPGVLAGYPYSVFFALRHENVLWVLLESATALKYEWARADMDIATGKIEFGVYVGSVFGE